MRTAAGCIYTNETIRDARLSGYALCYHEDNVSGEEDVELELLDQNTALSPETTALQVDRRMQANLLN